MIIILVVLAYCGVAACFLLLMEALKVLGEHKEEISKNRAAIKLLSKRLDDVASMVALCPDDVNPVDYCPDDVNIFSFEEVENNEQ